MKITKLISSDNDIANTKIEYQNKINDLKAWFQNYDETISKYQRLMRLEVKDYTQEIHELDIQAEANRKAIQEYELKIAELEAKESE